MVYCNFLRGSVITAGDLRQAYASGISAEFQQVFLTFKETELDDAVSALEIYSDRGLNHPYISRPI